MDAMKPRPRCSQCGGPMVWHDPHEAKPSHLPSICAEVSAALADQAERHGAEEAALRATIDAQAGTWTHYRDEANRQRCVAGVETWKWDELLRAARHHCSDPESRLSAAISAIDAAMKAVQAEEKP
jgi:hypothetical protein